MSGRLSHSQKLLHDSLFELYLQGGLELMTLGTRGLKRELIIDLEMSALTPDKGEVIHFYAVNRWDGDDFFDEWARPAVPLTADAERILSVTNDELSQCRSVAAVLGEFLDFLMPPVS